MAAAHPALGLRVRQLVPQRAAAGVAEAVEGALAGLHVRVPQAQAALHLLQHRAPAGVHAEVLERAPEVGDVGAHALDAEHAAHHQGLEELQLLGQGQDQGPQRGDVGLERVAGHRHELPRLVVASAAGSVPTAELGGCGDSVSSRIWAICSSNGNATSGLGERVIPPSLIL